MFNWMKARLNMFNAKDLGSIARDKEKWRKTNHDPSTTGDVMVQEEDCHALLVKVNAKGFTRVFAIVNLFALTCTNTNPRVKYMRRDFTEAFLPSILRQSCPPLLETFHFISTN